MILRQRLSRLIALLVLAFGCLGLPAQVVSYTPAFPTIDDTVTITFDASQGNAALSGVSPVFAHTGVINRFSTDASDWEHQVSEWLSGYDSSIVMTPLGGNLHRISLKPRSFYGISSTEKARAMAFVFRDELGTLAGKNADGSDIFIPLFASTGFSALFAAPIERDPVLSLGQNLPIQIKTNQPALITLYRDGLPLAQSSGLVTDFSTGFMGSTYGKYRLSFTADNGTTVLTDTIACIVQPPVTIQNAPAGTRDGINYINGSTVILQLLAPGKDYVYVIGDFNGWQLDPAYQMKKSTDGERHWVQINGLTPGREYRFQYFVDHQIKVGDPWATKVLDPFNDSGIPATIYPGLIAYPSAYTNELVTVFQTNQPAYNWQVTNFQKPDNRDLVTYELLVRDFVQKHDYQTLIDTLDYLQRLGVNAIELMPINEFDGNQSWGYGPAFYCAPDKYYGTETALKAFIDECHARGIAIIFDVVFNHSFGQSPLVRLYQDRTTGKASPDNPWFNVDGPHPLGLGYDFNHESPYTRAMIDSVLGFWTREYKADGFRFDLSKGFTQTFTSNIGDWSNRDQGRINSLKRIYDRYRQYNGGAFLILEHFAANDEETELASHGFMFWGNASESFAQAAMGYEQNSDFSFAISHQSRGWPFHNLMGFMESHDEERLMYDCITYGNSANPSHNVKDSTIALKRMALVAAFWATVPGPKMLWQFGELGYDYSIDFGCRTCPKPVRWNYIQDQRRQYLMKVYAALIRLKTQNPGTFGSSSYDISAWGKQKQIHVNAAMNATVIGNFDVYFQDVYTGFQHTGRWYDYLSGDSINVTDVNMLIQMGPGEFKVFTDQRQPKPDLSFDSVVVPIGIAPPLPQNTLLLQAFPNPTSGATSFGFTLPKAAEVELTVVDASGKVMRVVQAGKLPAGAHTLVWDGLDAQGQALAAGMYVYRLRAGEVAASGRLSVVR
jgi:1,4-alpha-glucan branching enzyme